MKIQAKTENPANYQRGSRAGATYIVVHYTGNKGDTAAGNATYFAREAPGVSPLIALHA